MRRLAFAAFLGLVPLLACSDDSDSASGSDDEDTEATSEHNAEDQELADAAVLTLEDLPSGWEVSPEEENADEQQDELNQAFADCLGIDVSEIDDDYPEAQSSFANADDEEVSSAVEVAPSAEGVQEDLDRFRDREAQQCFRDLISEEIAKAIFADGEDLELGEVTFNELSFDDVGDDSLAFRLTVPLSSEGSEVELFQDYVLVTKGRTGVTMTFQSVFTPFDEAEALRLTEVVIDRVPADA